MLETLKKLIGMAVIPTIPLDPTGSPFVALRGADGQMVVTDLRNMRDRPNRRISVVNITDVSDFIEYVLSHQAQRRTVMFVKPNASKDNIDVGIAVLDYHGDMDAPDWCANTASLTVRLHPLYKIVRRLFDWQKQADFAKNIRIAGSLFSLPTPADMLTLAQTLRVTSEGKFQSQLDDTSGSVNFAFAQINRASAGTQERTVSIPETVMVTVPKLMGEKPSEIALRFEFRAPSDPGQQAEMRLVYDNDEIDDYNMIEGIVARIAASGIEVSRGMLLK